MKAFKTYTVNKTKQKTPGVIWLKRSHLAQQWIVKKQWHFNAHRYGLFRSKHLQELLFKKLNVESLRNALMSFFNSKIIKYSFWPSCIFQVHRKIWVYSSAQKPQLYLKAWLSRCVYSYIFITLRGKTDITEQMTKNWGIKCLVDNINGGPFIPITYNIVHQLNGQLKSWKKSL